MGDIVINSVKRSLGSRSWEGELYLWPRDSRSALRRFTFAAPAFYHLTILFFKILNL